MKYCVAALLIALTLSQAVTILNSDPSTTVIINPPSLIVGNEGYHNANQPDFLGTGAKWIWNNVADGWPEGYQNTFQAVFYADCPKVQATLTVAADNLYEAFLNGVSVLSGDNWMVPNSKMISLKCGENNLTIVVTNLHPGTPAALIYSITQDQTNCYGCPSALTSYNSATCSCECVNGNAKSCNCQALNPNWVWQPAPVCGCSCPKIPKCNYNQEFNANTCSCECKRKNCPFGFPQNKLTCQCGRETVCPEIGICAKKNNVWNPSICACTCPKLSNCNRADEWNNEKCACVGRT